MGRKGSQPPMGLAVACASEVRAELGRRGLTVSSLDGVLGSHTYVFARLSPDKATIPLNLNDVATIEQFFGWSEMEILRRGSRMMHAGERLTTERGYTSADEAAIRRTVEDL